MSKESLESIDPELDRLLELERQASPPKDALGRIWSRIQPVVPAGVGKGGGHGGGGGPNGWFAAQATTALAVAFLGGGVTGATAYAVLQRPPPERTVYIERTPATVPTPPVQPVAPEGSIPLLASATLTRPSAPPVIPSASTSLSAERMVIDQARGDLASGNAAHALVLLNDHVHRFLKPQLAEEREALVIQSLVTLHRYDDARAAAARFGAASPDSLFLPVIEGSLESIP